MGQITYASRTLSAINAALEADQGASWRGWMGKVVPHLGDAFNSKEDGFRTHLGASMIGRECAREIWYGFRWAKKPKFEGRMLRLFNRGHLEEGRVIALLLMIGVQVYQQDANGKQFRISEFGGHFGGSGDGVGINIPDVQPGQPVLLEFKTHGDKSFQNMIKMGVRLAKPEHYTQMQVYMRKMGLATALYVAVNKNDDHIHMELIYLNDVHADQFIDRAGKIIPIYVPPKKISESLGAMSCKFCEYKPVCKQGEQPERNCRTCAYSSPNVDDGRWWCDNKDRRMKMLFGPQPGISEEKEDFSLSKERQLRGCDMYLKNPNM